LGVIDGLTVAFGLQLECGFEQLEVKGTEGALWTCEIFDDPVGVVEVLCEEWGVMGCIGEYFRG
jgi:hypothetical protein